jgi:pimeloyl-ACP methyl ester carboxylesterase
MPAVLVHGVPETARLWNSVRSHLHRQDVVAVALPGFGTPRPDGFGATMDEYAAWLTGHLETLDQPIDLVGHDWGAGFTMRLVSLRPDLVRSWVLDAAGLADPDFEWHDFAKLWQTPGDGEAFWEEQLALSTEERAGVFLAFGVPQDDAMAMASAVDATMAGCILDLYRSATQVQDDWGPDFVDISKPGMVVIPSDDPFLDAEGATRAALRAGARTARLEGVGHWWMAQDPEAAAALLESFWEV